jgi:hypothetical protein
MQGKIVRPGKLRINYFFIKEEKTMKKLHTLFLVIALLAIAVVPVMAANTASTPVSAGGITPYIIDGENPGGNRTCAEVGLAFFDDADYYQFSSERVNYEGGSFDGAFPAGLSVNTDGTYVSFSSTFGIGAVIVKGSDDANVYVYEPQRKSDSGLASPPNASTMPAGLSNITFCWNPENEVCYEEETAWAAGTRYSTERGNWATFTPYSAGSTVNIFAGQTILVGTATFSQAVDGMVTITIELEGARFQNVEENLKVQGYTAAPSGNPNPGGFAFKSTETGSSASITVPAANFYGVHLDVEVEVPCQ